MEYFLVSLSVNQFSDMDPYLNCDLLMSHGSCHPPWRETEEDRKRKALFLRYEIRELQKTMRLWSKCGQFNQFIYVKRDIAYLHFACPKCSEVIQVPHLTTPNDNRKWEWVNNFWFNVIRMFLLSEIIEYSI